MRHERKRPRTPYQAAKAAGKAYIVVKLDKRTIPGQDGCIEYKGAADPEAAAKVEALLLDLLGSQWGKP